MQNEENNINANHVRHKYPDFNVALSIAEFYAYYQWFYDMPSAEVIEKIPVDFLMKA